MQGRGGLHARGRPDARRHSPRGKRNHTQACSRCASEPEVGIQAFRCEMCWSIFFFCNELSEAGKCVKKRRKKLSSWFWRAKSMVLAFAEIWEGPSGYITTWRTASWQECEHRHRKARWEVRAWAGASIALCNTIHS